MLSCKKKEWKTTEALNQAPIFGGAKSLLGAKLTGFWLSKLGYDKLPVR